MNKDSTVHTMDNPNSSIADYQQRRQALEPDTSFIVQAPAGSGKTELLTQRYLRLLATVASPEEIIAITFTRKAAGEMRQRIISSLDKAEKGFNPESPHEKLTNSLAIEVLAQDKKHSWQLALNPVRLRIQTIDSLCAYLAGQMPVLSRFGTLPAITEDADELYKEAARLTVLELEAGESWSSSVAHLIGHLGNNLVNLQTLIATMLGQRDRWLRHVADKSHPKLSRGQLQEAISSIVVDALENLENSAPRNLLEQLVPLAQFAAVNLKAENSRSGIVLLETLASMPGKQLADLNLWKALANLLLTNDGNVRKMLSVSIGFPSPGSATNKEEKQKYQACKQLMAELLAELGSCGKFIQQLGLIRQLPYPSYNETQWRTLEALFDILRLAVAQLEIVFQSEGMVDFSAVSQAALTALGEEDNPTDLALSLDYKIQHILMDEFQDTSMMQYQLLERLIAGWEPQDGRTLFVVGDPMQSIYRFRDAEVGLFLRAWYEGIADVHLTPLTLSVNFRSDAGIIDWVNETFKQMLPAESHIETGAVKYSPSTVFHRSNGGKAVSYHIFSDDESVAESEKVLEIVKSNRRASSHATLAILVRSRSHLIEIIGLLKKSKVRYKAVEIEHLTHRAVIQDLMSLTRALLHRGDRVSWLTVLRAPWCGLTLDDLHALVGAYHDEVVWDSVNCDDRLKCLSVDGQSRLHRVRNVLGAALDNRHRLPLRDWVEGVWCALGGPACLQEETDIEDAATYFDMLDKLESGGDISDLEYLNHSISLMFASPDTKADDSLQVMSIHKSKGLEFDTVIVPGLARIPRQQEQRLLMWMERPGVHDRNDLLLAPIKSAEDDTDDLYRLLTEMDAEKARFEDGRLLYVAATRARKQLHLMANVQIDASGQVKPPVRNTLLSQFWPIIENDVNKNVFQGEGSEKTVNQELESDLYDRSISRLSLDWKLPMLPAPISFADSNELVGQFTIEIEEIEFSWAGETAKHIGTVVHKQLQMLGNQKALDDVRKQNGMAIAAMLRQAGVPDAQLISAVQVVKQALGNVASDKRGQWLFSDDHYESSNELALTAMTQEGIRKIVIDRTFIDNQGVRWIVDYKTSSHLGVDIEEFLEREKERYQSQLNRYASVMEMLDCSRSIRCGLYFPLLKGWLEWPYERS
ncbi:MAG: UvrD-helicase domain-containing protein [Gammaproteobacteria bacterium]